MRATRREEIFDAVIVGSGATGGWAAKQLTEAGMKVLVLEAGGALNPEKDYTEHLAPYEVKYRGFSPEIKRTRPIQSRCYACSEYNYQWFVNDLENPYITPPDKPYNWFRLRVLGGRSLAWYRLCYRFSDLDFKAARHDGYGEDWPLSYADLEPYYDLVEKFIGVSGAAERLPQLPDGRFLPPMPMTCGELLLRDAARRKFGRTVTIGRQANLTAPHNGRPPCHYCGPCERGCITHSYFSSPSVTLPAAQATGRLTLVTDAVVSQVTTDLNTGRASGVRYVDRSTRQVREVRGKIVILCAQALESARILLNSSSRHFPNGLANSSGALGHYLMDHISGFGANGVMPMLTSKPWVGPPRRPNVVYVPRFQNVTDRHPGFIRGYGLQGSSQADFAFQAAGFGREFKEAVKRGGWSIYLKAYGECLPRRENYVELDPEVVDAWGIPALRVVAAFGDNELKMGHDAASAAAEMLEAAGAREIKLQSTPDVFGNSIHDVGTTRMGDDPRKSVLNQYCQSHDIPNLFVMDGGCFVSSPCQNPTLTMMAIVCRCCAYLVGRFKKGEI
jgi:glucoside 3-dehydrogenase (cytochrome c) catalytic subunit